MQLTRFRVRKFRNIVDSGDIAVDPHVTCLVGMNEAGKTAILAALHRLNPVGRATFDVQRDYPRWLANKDRKAGLIDDTRPIEADFELDAEEVARISARFGEKVLTSKTITVYRKYNGATVFYSVACDEADAVSTFLAKFDLPESLKAELGAPKTFGDLRDALDVAEEDADNVMEAARQSISTGITQLLGDRSFRVAVFGELELPSFFYFGEYSVLEGKIDLDALTGERDDDDAASSAQTARALLALADTNAEALCSDDYEDRTSELEAVSVDLTEQVFEYWRQNPSLRVKFDTDRKIENDPNGHPRVVANHLHIRVEDTRHHFTNSFSHRSSGFRWFFSFLAAFTEFETRSEKFVILLDEPALTLHGRAQADFLRFINERLAPGAPVIYTTHSPFMVETDRIERVRIVEDKGPKEGAVASQEALTVSADSLFPLQAALGYDVAQHLFIGNSNLLVEGPSDYLYLDVVSRRLGREDRTQLDERLRILPAGGASNIPAFVALIGRALEVTVLIDSGTEGAGKLDAALEAGRISKSRLVCVGEVIGAKHADIEDLFAVGDYLALYNKVFGKRVKADSLPMGDRIIHRLEQLHGKFDHYKPAEALLRNPALLDGLSDETLSNFEKLIQRINATL
ncbi:AAA family ATPase [Mycolicibacterium fortuitum]